MFIDKDKISKLLLVSKYKYVIIVLIITPSYLVIFSNIVMAKVEASFLYSLSNFSGPIPYNWAKLSVDIERNEIYVVDSRLRDVRVFNAQGMEIYRFGDDAGLSSIVDVAVNREGNIFVLTRGMSGTTINLCNFRGDLVSEVQLRELPSDFSGLHADRLDYRDGLLYLVDSNAMRIAVVDESGVFRKSYDIRARIQSFIRDDKKKRGDAGIGGFSVDREGNLLFTIPTFFSAFKLTPEGEISGFGTPGSAPGAFGIVGGIVADDEGNYYVADRLRCVVLIFDKNFRFLKEFGYRGFRKDNLIGPLNLALDAKGRLYVSQLRNRGISVFGIAFK